jgi:hydroxymethylbilane synthase
LAIEGRKGDEGIQRFIAFLNDRNTQISVTAERAFLKKLGGGCQIPVAGLAQVAEGRVNFRALVASLDGKKVIQGQVEGSEKEASDLGEKLAEELLAKGGKEILDEVYQKE